MTREHLLVMDVNEITGIRWECQKCRSAVTYRLNETIHLSQSCTCGAKYIDNATHGELIKAVEFVEKLKALIAGTPNLKATLKFELRDSTSGVSSHV